MRGDTGSVGTLFLRGMPTQLVRRVKAEAARRGVTLARLVAETLERLPSAAGPPDEDAPGFDPELEASLRWYEANRRRLAKRHAGEHVAILGQRVVDHDRDFAALAERVFARHGVRNLLMPKVEADDRIARLRSPRRVGR